MRDNVSLSFDPQESYSGGPYQRRPVDQLPPQGRPGSTSMYNGAASGPGPGLPFMSFDLASGSGNPPSRVGNYGRGGGYGGYAGGGYDSFVDEPPLLEELGINFSQIIQKMRTVLNPFNMNPNLHEDPDLSGPFLFCMLFGLAQLLAGKVHFGVILGWTSIVSLLLYMIFNLLAGSNGNLDLYRCVSIVGYSLVPMVVFATLSVFLPSRGVIKYIIAAVTVFWCTKACTTLMVVLFPYADELRTLIAYPAALIFMAFSFLVLF